MECLGAFRKLLEVALQHFGERIEQAPDVPRLEFLMTWLTPFMQHQRNVPVGAGTDIQSTNQEIVGRAVVEGDLT